MGTWLAVPPHISRAAGSVAVAVGFIVLIGWVTGVDVLKSLIPGTITMKANTAIGFIMLGGSLVVLSRAGSRAWALAGYGLAVSAMLLAGLVGSQYVTGRDLGIDHLLFVEPPGAVGTVDPGRLSPQTAISFFALGVAVLVARRPRTGWAVTILTAIPLVMGAVNLIEVVYGAGAPVFLAAHTQMAVPTAGALMILSIGVTTLTPNAGWLGVFIGRHPSSRLARRLLLSAIVIPLTMGWLRLQGERLGLYHGAYGVSLMVLGSIVLFVIVVRQTAASQIKADARRARAELEMAQAREQAERANHAKSEFLSRMSHELRTPLNAILGFGQLLEMENLTPHQRESANYIVKGGRHLLRLIDDVLDIARIETGRLSMSPESVPVREVVDEALALVSAAAAESQVEICVEGAVDDEFHVWADRQRLRQVLVNLLSNAIKYNRRGGSVRVAYDRTPDQRLRISVIDEGPGVAPAQMSRLFLPFERLGAEYTGVEGTGIGLALSKALVEAMGGSIGVHSTVGKGSIFWIDLLSAESPLERFDRLGGSAPAADDAVERARRKVVYIEDNPSNVKLLERVFALRPHIELHTAATGKSGLEVVQAERPELVLLDLDLPDIEGETVLRALRSDPATATTPVLVISADATAGSIRRLQQEGARAYLTKPIDVDYLLKTVDATLAPAEVAA